MADKVKFKGSVTNDQLIGLNSSTTGSYGFNYDDANRLAAITRPGSRTDFTFDAGSALTKISHSASGVEKSFHEYSYDLRNYITQKRSPASTLDYSYDTNGQLLSANKAQDTSQNESFSYDALGNRLTYNGLASTYDNSGQRIQDDGQYTYVFDANGNIIYKSSKVNGISYSFEYSSLNQLKKATVTSSPLGGSVLKSIEYKYDPVGRRIQRVLVDNVNSSKSNTKKYYYDGSNILAELDAGNNLTASYTYSPLRADDILGAKFTSYASPAGAISEGQVLAQSAGYAYYLKDHLNTIHEIVNAGGDIVQKMDYSTFGVLRSVKDSSGSEVGFANAPVRTSFTYTGREFEPELGVYYYRARYYDASTVRFLQQDPDPGKLANPSTFLSKYIYAGNSPMMYSDPSGASILGDVFNTVFNAGHDFIATFGASFDMLVKSELFQNIAFVAFVIAVAIVTPQVALVAGIATLVQASATGDYSLNNIRNSFIRNYVSSFVFASLGEGGAFASISLSGAASAIGTNVFLNLYSNDARFRARLNESIENSIRDLLNRIGQPPRLGGY